MTDIMKLQAPFDRLRSYGINPDVALRKAIILQAIVDIMSINQSSKAKAVLSHIQSPALQNPQNSVSGRSYATSIAKFSNAEALSLDPTICFF